jgi:hypothetical protein
MQVNLERKAPPTVTQSRQMPYLGYNASAYALAFTITMGSTVAHEDYDKRMTIGPASLSASADRTNTVWLEEKGGAGESWLAKAIAEMHAGIPDKAWEDVPDTSKFDIDSML